MADSRKYYWLKLKTDFFKGYKAKLLRAYDNGDTYLLLYLQLLLESVSHNGNLRFSETLAYDEKSLSVICDTNIDIVKSALKAFEDLELIEIWGDKTIHMTDLEKMIGSETESARKKQAYREKIALQSQLKLQESSKKDNVRVMSEKCPTELDIELDIRDRDRVKDKDIKSNPKKEIKHTYGDYKHIKLTDKEKDKLIEWLGNQETVNYWIKKVDEGIEMKGYKYKNCYLAIRQWVNRDNKNTPKQGEHEHVETSF